LKSPIISVLVPAHQAERYVAETLKSILNQTAVEWECVFSDDASTDQTHGIAKAFADRDSRFRIFRQTKNLGMVGNWNFCLNQAKGKACILVPADDKLSDPDSLRTYWGLLQTQGVLLAVAPYLLMDDNSIPGRLISDLPPGLHVSSRITSAILRHQDNLIGPPACGMFWRNRGVKGYDPSAGHAADIDLWWKFMQSEGWLHVGDRPLSLFRIHGNQLSNAVFSSGIPERDHLLWLLRRCQDTNVHPDLRYWTYRRAKRVIQKTANPRVQELRPKVWELGKSFPPIDRAFLSMQYGVSRFLDRQNASLRKTVAWLRRSGQAR
jgi:glycosyltransferase involved in cell wall biosynthesis